MKMEYRKVQVTGKSTYVVSLPKKWVKKNELDKSSVVILEELENGIFLRVPHAKEKKIEINVKNLRVEEASRLLIAKYIQGFNVVKFKSPKFIEPEIKSALKKTSHLLIGMETFGETSNEIIFRMLMRECEDVSKAIERMHNMSFSSLRNVIMYIKDKPRSNNILRDVISMDNEIDKFYFFILRHLSTIQVKEAIVFVIVAKSIERLSDHVERIARILLENNKTNYFEIYETLITLYGKVNLALKSRSQKIANEIIEEVKKFEEEYEKLSKKEENVLVHESFKRIADYISDIAECVINLS